MVINIDRKNETEHQTLLRRFAEAAQAITDATGHLLETWTAVEMGIDGTPSDIKGYPYNESLDEMLSKVLEWNASAQTWAQDLAGSESLKMRTIARHINQRWPELQAQSHHSGGGIYGIFIPYSAGPTAGSHLFWGTANETWGADIVDSEGDVIGNVEAPVRCDHGDLLAVARAIALFSRDAIETATTIQSGQPFRMRADDARAAGFPVPDGAIGVRLSIPAPPKPVPACLPPAPESPTVVPAKQEEDDSPF